MKLPCGHWNFFTMILNGQFLCVHRKSSDGQFFALRNPHTAKQCADMKCQLLQIDRLDHIIVDPNQIPFALGRHIVFRRHKQDGGIRICLPCGLSKLKPVDLRHHDVRNDKIVFCGIHGIVGIRCT